MARVAQPSSATPAQPDEGVRWVGAEAVSFLSERTADREAAFFLPHLTPNLRLLDCGCGSGTLTVGLAQRVAPGQVIGLDREPAQVEKARSHAAQHGVANVEFRVGNVYELPYPDGAFDAVFAHAVLQHLADPMQALREMHRVLEPGGVIGLREEDRDADLIYPFTPRLQEAHKLLMRLWQQVGGDPYFPKRYRAVLREAGFVRIRMSASCEYRADLATTRTWARVLAEFLEGPDLAGVALDQGWADRTTLAEMAAALLEWAEHPDAFWAETWCEAVGWKVSCDTTSL
jgi:ubiquinone/menaquinone biosynthesis C-methylase UbiE